MKVKKTLFLLLALLLPIAVFLFLKIFGKNEFAVPPLYSNAMPDVPKGCSSVIIPYHIPDSVLQSLAISQDSLGLIWFGSLADERLKQYKKITEAYNDDPIVNINLDSEPAQRLAKCVFFLKSPHDMVLVDKRGLIRGQYVSSDRDEIDRLKIEIDIILKKY